MRLPMMILILALSLGAAVCAQPGADARPESADPTFSLDYPGGKLDSFVAQLEKQVPGLNLIVHSQAKGIEVQPLSLKNVNVTVAISAIQELLEPRIEVFEIKGPPGKSKVRILRPRQIPVRTTAFHLGPDQQNGGATKALDVIEFSITSLPNADRRTKPKVKLHEPSGILLVTADDEQLSLIGKVIGMLGGSGLSGGGKDLFGGGGHVPPPEHGGYGGGYGGYGGGGYGGGGGGGGYGGGYGGEDSGEGVTKGKKNEK